jgi:glyoxylate/hydroxypyruvate reductase
VLYHHRSVPEYRRFQTKHDWHPLPRKRAEERTVGFLGQGTLGKPMAEYIKSHGFNVIAWARTPKPGSSIETFAGDAGFGPFLAKTEILVNMLPLTDDTRGILNAKTFAQLPKGASVINLARGGHLVDKDLIAALDSGQLGAATLDVTEPEPLPPESPLWDHPGVTLLPHVARRPTLAETMPQIIENMRRLRSGQPLILRVDETAGY